MADRDIERLVDAYDPGSCGNPPCRAPLRPNSLSTLFCSEDCQADWFATLVDPTAIPYDEVLACVWQREATVGQWWAAGRRAA